MKQVFKLGKTHRSVNISLGIVLTINGISMIYLNSLPPVGLIFGILLVLFGIANLYLYSVNKSLLRIEIDDHSIFVKDHYIGKSRTLIWDEINKIEFGPYQLRIWNKDDSKVLSYDCDAETSKAIKTVVMELANSKNIETSVRQLNVY